MLEKRIKLYSLKDKSDFLKVTSAIACDIDLRYGGQLFDAKSIMSVMNIDSYGAETVILRIHSKDTEILNKFKRWFV